MTFVTGLRGFPSKQLMSIRVLPLFALALLLSDLPASAQFGSPFPGGQGGGYPGGGYPGQGQGQGQGQGGLGGIPFPGRNRKVANGPVENVVGNIQRISTTQIVLDPGDRRNIVVMLDKNTKYFGKTGDSAKFGDFDAGDEVSIDAARDNQSMLHAQRVTLNSKGAAGNISADAPQNSDADRPKLKRAQGSDATPAESPSRAAASREAAPPDDPDRPRLRRNPAPTAQAEAPEESTRAPSPNRRVTATRPVEGDPVTTSRRADAPEEPLRPVARNDDDPGPPVLRRGGGATPATRRAPTVPVETASARPSIKSEEVNGIVRAAPAPVIEAPSARQPEDAPRAGDNRLPSQVQPTGDPIINAAREAAWQWADTLPNYIVKQFTTRYQTETSRGNRTSWQALDVVTADVVSENGKESYKNLQINGKPTKDVEKSGSWSTGEFSTILLNLLSPGTDADFHAKRTSTIGSRQAWRYDYTVEQQNSNWNIIAASQTYKPAYSGAIWVDKQTNRVLRIEMASKNMPQGFPLDTVESAVEYDFVLVGDQKFLLPTHSEALSCTRGSSDCTRNTIDFRNYRKFGADTSITFETEKP